jgi:hypothetical protein
VSSERRDVRVFVAEQYEPRVCPKLELGRAANWQFAFEAQRAHPAKGDGVASALVGR